MPPRRRRARIGREVGYDPLKLARRTLSRDVSAALTKVRAPNASPTTRGLLYEEAVWSCASTRDLACVLSDLFYHVQRSSRIAPGANHFIAMVQSDRTYWDGYQALTPAQIEDVFMDPLRELHEHPDRARRHTAEAVLTMGARLRLWRDESPVSHLLLETADRLWDEQMRLEQAWTFGRPLDDSLPGGAHRVPDSDDARNMMRTRATDRLTAARSLGDVLTALPMLSRPTLERIVGGMPNWASSIEEKLLGPIFRMTPELFPLLVARGRRTVGVMEALPAFIPGIALTDEVINAIGLLCDHAPKAAQGKYGRSVLRALFHRRDVSGVFAKSVPIAMRHAPEMAADWLRHASLTLLAEIPEDVLAPLFVHPSAELRAAAMTLLGRHEHAKGVVAKRQTRARQDRARQSRAR